MTAALPSFRTRKTPFGFRKKFAFAVGEVDRRLLPAVLDEKADRSQVLVIHAGVHGEQHRPALIRHRLVEFVQ